VRLAKRVDEILKNAGFEPKAVPLKLLLPSFEQASLEDDDSLQDKWAALLAEASNPDSDASTFSVFAEILRQLSPYDSKFLEHLAHYPPTSGNLLGSRRDEGLGSLSALENAFGEAFPNRQHLLGTDPQFRVSLQNLVRLGLLRTRQIRKAGEGDGFFSSPDRESDDHRILTVYSFSALGNAFLTIVGIRQEEQEEEAS
jgi:hypothetical protein